METDPIQRCGSKANVEEVAVWTNFCKKIWKKEENKLIGKMVEMRSDLRKGKKIDLEKYKLLIERT